MKLNFMQFSLKTVAVTVALSLAGSVLADNTETPAGWYKQGNEAVKAAMKLHPNKKRAKNVILFVGDGMGVSTVTAARILEGQLRGAPGEENLLSFEKLPYVAMSKTYNTNQQTPDSAGTMTAMMTGVKSKAGVISVNQNVTRGDCASTKGNELRTFLEEAEMAGLSTGIVSTARITHATPAATYAHVPERNWESDDKLPQEAKDNGCKDIARQLIEFPYGNGLEVAMGGGRRHFLPKSLVDGEGKTGKRKDGRNLTEEWTSNYKKSAFIWNKQQFDNIDTNKVEHLLGLFESSHMEYEQDRPTDAGGEPSLSEMTDKAIDVLAKNDKGFFLHVESGRIDHGHHAGNAYRALTDAIEFSNAIKLAMEKTNPEDTLILVTADHSHVFTIAGYPTRGNSILGKVVSNDNAGNSTGVEQLAKDGMPYTTVSYANGNGSHVLATGGDTSYGEPINTGRLDDLSGIDTTDEGFHQQALVPLSSETHSGEDVTIYAGGPGSHLVHGVQEQNVIYHVMRAATRMAKGHKSEHEHEHEKD